MAISIYSNSGTKAYGIKTFLVDTPEDIEKLSTNYAAGCSAFVASDSSIYVLNNQHEWVQVTQNISE